MRELSVAKRLANNIAEGLVLNFEPKTECDEPGSARLRHALSRPGGARTGPETPPGLSPDRVLHVYIATRRPAH